MKYHNITKDDMLNGDGLRVALWVSGCEHDCPGCHNAIAQDPDGGIPFDDAAKAEIFAQLEKAYISGITFTGGDPLYEANRPVIGSLIAEIRERFPEKTIWLYTGASWEEVYRHEMLRQVDVLIDGEFIEAEKDTKLFWKGSANQRVIDVRRTLADPNPAKPILYCGSNLPPHRH